VAKFHAFAYMLVPAIVGGAAAVLLMAGSLLSWMNLSNKQRRSRSVWPIRPDEDSDPAIDDSDFLHPAHLRFPPVAAADAEGQPFPTQLPTAADMDAHDEASSGQAVDVIIRCNMRRRRNRTGPSPPLPPPPLPSDRSDLLQTEEQEEEEKEEQQQEKKKIGRTWI